MSNNYQKGKLKRWNDNKGFGFIESGSGKDIFIHISALKKAKRRPKIGDIILYQIHTDNDGKKRAVNARIEGVAEAGRRRAKKKNKSGFIFGIIFIVLIMLLVRIVYNKFMVGNNRYDERLAQESSYEEKRVDKQNYSCAGKVYCSEMTSCEEAKYYQRNCPDTKMDGDGDGIPCERQWCGY